jgi:hypothetical protein
MSWRDAAIGERLASGTRVQVEVQFYAPPFFAPDDQAIREALDGTITVGNVDWHTLENLVSTYKVVSVDGPVVADTDPQTLGAEVAGRLSNLWNAMGVSTRRVQVYVPGLSLPDIGVGTTVTMVALAVIVVVVFVALRKGEFI